VTRLEWPQGAYAALLTSTVTRRSLSEPIQNFNAGAAKKLIAVVTIRRLYLATASGVHSETTNRLSLSTSTT
jgi:hypothetical protein